MKVRAVLVLLAMVLIFTVSESCAGLISGNELVQYMKGFDKGQLRNEMGNEDLWNAASFVAYIAGVLDSASETVLRPRYKLPDGVTITQIATIVSNYLKTHPEQWADPGSLLIIKSLDDAFPVNARPKKGSTR